MTRYIVKEIIDRWPVGEDVTGRYLPDVAQRLVDEGYLTAVDDAPTITPLVLPAPEVAEPATGEDGN